MGLICSMCCFRYIDLYSVVFRVSMIGFRVGERWKGGVYLVSKRLDIYMSA